MRFLLIVALSLISSAFALVASEKSEIALEPRDIANVDNTTTVDKGFGAGDAIEAIINIVNLVQDRINKDKAARSQFTQDLVSRMHAAHPNFNWIICHTKHTYKFDGRRGVDWDHRHQEFDIKLGGTIGYEIYNLKSGEFTRQGDGGYLNWAYIGRVIKSDQGGKHLVFGAP
ncbi:hypothetical protein ONZ45_g3104 [Pleurotus djamor]|nr:hypothetical protein ONZ45_g3104 [Pleurotus djamor]